jgi:hypothetical protein
MRIVADEPQWRVSPQGPAVASSPRAIATHWRADGMQETGAETAEIWNHRHAGLMKVALSPLECREQRGDRDQSGKDGDQECNH